MNNQINEKPLYPEEAYTPQNNQNNEQKTEQNFMDNPLLPLLLSSMQEGDNKDIMPKLLSALGGNNSKLIETLTSTMSKKKDKKETPSGASRSFPKNEDFD